MATRSDLLLSRRPWAPPFPARLPGVALCLAVTLAAYATEAAERRIAGKAWLEPLVLAILLGMALRSGWVPGRRWAPGIAFSGKALLETAVVLLGASVSLSALAAAGPALILGIVATVALVVPAGFAIGRALGLPCRLALLVACGNAICGNSAIAAVAPVIGADGEEVAAAIGFTAVMGVAVVLGLPVLGTAFGLAGAAYGAFAGLTVYAVPQVIAAAAPAGAVAVQAGTLVKLLRVLMLGPVCLALSLLGPRPVAPIADARRPALVPWFILAFLLLAGLRSAELVPDVLVAPAARVATGLTVMSMAALGLGVDLADVGRAGGRVTAAVLLSLLTLGGLALALVRMLPLA